MIELLIDDHIANAEENGVPIYCVALDCQIAAAGLLLRAPSESGNPEAACGAIESGVVKDLSGHPNPANEKVVGTLILTRGITLRQCKHHLERREERAGHRAGPTGAGRAASH
jgi:hypothetical protein